MLDKFLDSLHRDLLLESKWLDNLTCLDKHIALDQALIGVLSVPLFAHRHAHECIELLGAAKLIWQVLHPIFLSKLLVTLFSLIDLDAFQSCILPRFLYFFNFALSYGIIAFLGCFKARVVNAFASPSAPSLLDSGFLYRFTDLAFDLLILFLLKLFISVFFLRHKERLD